MTSSPLFKQARDVAALRGHLLNPFEPLEEGRTFAATCQRCGREVVVNLRPLPNEIDVSGEVVAMNCPACDATDSLTPLIDSLNGALRVLLFFHYARLDDDGKIALLIGDAPHWTDAELIDKARRMVPAAAGVELRVYRMK